MKLYYMQAACSFAPHIIIRELGVPFTLVRFDAKTLKLEDGRRIEEVNEKGFVPVLELDDGQRITEVAVILQYLADQKPELGLIPPAGTLPRYRVLEWLNYTATELHKAYWPLFHDGADIERSKAKEKLERNFAWVEAKLGDKPFLMGEQFTVADAYLLTVINWMRAGGLDPNKWPKLKTYRSRLRDRPSVHAALAAEGLLK
jgi:glutathione S-transferase